MKRILLLILCLSAAVRLSFGQCNETVQERVLLVGDSWAQFMNADTTFDVVFRKWGHSNFSYVANATIAFNGAVSNDFLDPTRLAEIQNQLNLNPDIDLVHLSIGGNDVLGDWNVNFTQAQTDSLMYSVYGKITAIIDSIKAMRPGIRIVWSGYAYPNFGQVITDLGALQTVHPFYSLWSGMGFPNFGQLNGILNAYSSKMDTLALTDPQVDFVRTNGLLQYLYGQNTVMSVPPSGTYAPFTAPLPDGYPNYPSPKNTMRNYGFITDCFHLSAAAFIDYMDYQTRKFYHKYLMDDQYLLSEGGSRDGSVTTSGVVSNNLQLGSVNGEDASLVLSFNTTQLPDTGIDKASIFLRRENLNGNNPVQSGSLSVRIVSGAFGTSVDVDASDFSDPGSSGGSPCLFGSYQNDGDWIRIELPSTILPYITNDTLTQFIISSSNASGVVNYSGAADPEYAPVLNLKFSPVTTGLSSTASRGNISVYPNPTTGMLNIRTAGEVIRETRLFDITGQLVLQSGNTTSIDISHVSRGLYLLHIITENGVVTERVVRQ